MLTATIAAGIFLRIVIVHIAKTSTGSYFLLSNKLINLLGSIALLGVLLGLQNPSVSLGVYIGFFFFDVLATLASIIEVIRLVKLPETTKKSKPKFANEKERRIAIIVADAQARLINNKNKLKQNGETK